MKEIFPMDHYKEAKKLLESGTVLSGQKAIVHGLLYVGDQLEALVGLFATTDRTRATPAQPDELTREEAGLT